MLLFILTVAPSLALAQARIQGRVTDPAGMAIADATVVAQRIDTTTPAGTAKTTATGNFEIGSLSPGTYVIRVEASGFRPVERRVTTTTGSIGELELHMDLMVSETVNVLGVARAAERPLDVPSETGSRLGLTARELPVSLDVVTQDVMRARGQRTVQEAVESAVGVTVGDSPGNPANFSMRGFTNNQVSVLHDGVRVGPPSMVSRPMDVWNLQRVDVLKGPASTLFGEGAVGGAINYVFKRPDRLPARAEGEVSYGGFNTVRLGLGAGGPIGTRGVHYRVDYALNDTDGFIDRTPGRLQSLTSALSWDVAATVDLQVSFDVLDDNLHPYWGTPLVPAAFATDPIDGVVRTPSGETIDRRMSRVNYNVGDNVMDSRTYWTRARAQWRPASGALVRNELYYLSANRAWFNAETYAFHATSGLIERDRFHVAHDQTIVGNRLTAQLDRAVGRYANRLLAGLDVNNLDLFRPSFFTCCDLVNPFTPRAGLFGPMTPANQTADITTSAVFLEDVFTPHPKLKLSAGLRADRISLDRQLFNAAGVLNAGASFSRTYTPLTWKVGVVHDVTPSAAVYGHVATAADPVNTNLFLVRAAEDFDLAKGYEVEVGTKQTLPRARGDWTAAVYRIERNNILTQTSSTTAAPVGQQSSYGLELSTNVRPIPRWQVQANLALVHARFDDFVEASGPGLVSRSGNRPFNVPAVVLGAMASYRVGTSRPVDVGLAYRHVGRRFTTADNLIRLEPYHIVDLSAAWALQRARVTARVRNLFDKDYAVWGDNFYPTQILLGPPRAAEIGLGFRF